MGDTLMRITKHEKSYIVELSDLLCVAHMACCYGGHLAVVVHNGNQNQEKIDDETCSHVLINQSDGSACG